MLTVMKSQQGKPVDVIVVTDRSRMGTKETVRISHLYRGPSALSRIDIEVNGPMSQYVVLERADISTSLGPGVWQFREMTQGQTRAAVFIEGHPGIISGLIGGSRLARQEGDKSDFPVGGSNRQLADSEKPFMWVATERATGPNPMPARELMAGIIRTLGNGVASRGIIVIR